MCLLYCACHAKCIFADPLQISHACQRFETATKPWRFCSLLTRCTFPSACHAKRHLNVQKVLRTPQFFDCFLHFWLRNVLRATTACTFWTSQLEKSGPRPSVFYTFHFHMCCAPQRCALFRHQLLKVRSWGVLYILTSKCASRHNAVHFFDITTSKSGPTLVCFVHFELEMCFAPQPLARWLCTRRFSESTFRPSGATHHGKKTVLRDFPIPFRAPGSSFFWDFLFSDLLSSALFSSTLLFSALLFSLPLPISAFHLSILSEVWLLNFLHLPSLPRKLAWKKLKKSESHRLWMCWLWVCQSLDGVGLTLSRSYIHIHLQSFYVFCSWNISGTHIFQIALPIHMLQIDDDQPVFFRG